MAYQNGRLPDQALAAIPGGRLRVDAAAAWNAMCAEARRRGLAIPMPDGPDSSYRSYERQVYWKNWWCAEGHCENAAEPGTSRHGDGIAVDCARDAVHHAATIEAIGERFGWSKKWSDAPWEPWHNTYKAGIWPPAGPVWPFLPLRSGSSGPWVYLESARLKRCGYFPRRTSSYDELLSAVRHFQQRHGLQVDGVTGPVTWAGLKDADRVCAQSGKPEV